jgi:CheY-like chemotaxis protein
MKKKSTILVVEDEDVLVELLRGTLEHHGFTVMTVRDGAEAIKLYKENVNKIDVVLTDMGLPSRGGWEVLEEVRKMNPSAKVICASGFLENSIREEMLAAGAAEFVQKPYAYTNLITLIRGLLQE